MTDYAFRLVNVFAQTPLAGNPLCVFEDARGLDDATMQALALQFNLSETTFVLPSTRATALVRIFTPTFEMPFAGHPTLGTAHVVRATANAGDRVSLEMKAGVIPVAASGDVWTLDANAPTHRAPSATNAQLAAMLGLAPADLLGPPLWIDTGSEQLIIPLADAGAVRRAQGRPHARPRQQWRARVGLRIRARRYACAVPVLLPETCVDDRGPRHRLGLREPGRLAAGDRRAAAAASCHRPGRSRGPAMPPGPRGHCAATNPRVRPCHRNRPWHRFPLNGLGTSR